MLTERQLATKTKALLHACGGLEEASKACSETARPYSTAQLSRCQTPGSGCFLPLDIINVLEDYCGKPIISQALFEARPCAAEAQSLLTEASETTESAAAFQARARRALADGVVTAREADELAKDADEMLEQAREAVAAVARLRVDA